MTREVKVQSVLMGLCCLNIRFINFINLLCNSYSPVRNRFVSQSIVD